MSTHGCGSSWAPRSDRSRPDSRQENHCDNTLSFLNKHGSYFLKLYQHRSYVIALQNAPYVDGMYLGEEQAGMSFRNYKNLLLVGGGDHRTGKKVAVGGNCGILSGGITPSGGAIPLGHAGLYEPGQCAVYRAVFRLHHRSVCCHRFQQVGHDYLHGVRYDSQRSCARKGKPV